MKKILVILVFVIFSINCGVAIKGRLTSIPDAKRIPKAQVTLTTKDDPNLIMKTQSSRGGVFKFKKLPAGVYSLYIQKIGFMDKEVSNIKFDAKKTLKLEIQMIRRARVIGKVLSEDGKPMPNIEIIAEKGTESTVSDEKGDFVLEYLDPGKNKLIGVGEKYISTPLEVDLKPGDNFYDIKVYEVDIEEIKSFKEGLQKEKKGTSGGVLIEDGSQ